ncbi:unnamed protein product [Protopolystoma xenopodis]|uniref:Uncharacterized protein n=1 Tax=Protopolystoma xenopodis TaxID=117903 RepID=A0A3S5BXI3_9PLAT|nr:unnamed protein product [Protopolystoma xenopodis]
MLDRTSLKGMEECQSCYFTRGDCHAGLARLTGMYSLNMTLVRPASENSTTRTELGSVGSAGESVPLPSTAYLASLIDWTRARGLGPMTLSRGCFTFEQPVLTEANHSSQRSSDNEITGLELRISIRRVEPATVRLADGADERLKQGREAGKQAILAMRAYQENSVVYCIAQSTTDSGQIWTDSEPSTGMDASNKRKLPI